MTLTLTDIIVQVIIMVLYGILVMRSFVTFAVRREFLHEISDLKSTPDFYYAMTRFNNVGPLKQIVDFSIWNKYQYFPWFYIR